MSKPTITTTKVRLVIDVPIKIVQYADRVHVEFDGRTPYDIEPEITNQIQVAIEDTIKLPLTRQGSWFSLPFCQDFHMFP